MPASDPAFDPAFLQLPARPAKPRQSGIAHVMDKGLTRAQIDGLVETAGEYVDIVKLGWGTSYVTRMPAAVAPGLTSTGAHDSCTRPSPAGRTVGARGCGMLVSGGGDGPLLTLAATGASGTALLSLAASTRTAASSAVTAAAMAESSRPTATALDAAGATVTSKADSSTLARRSAECVTSARQASRDVSAASASATSRW